MKKKDGMIGWLMKCSSCCLIFMGCSLMITGFSLLLTGCTEKARKEEKKNIKVETIFQASERPYASYLPHLSSSFGRRIADDDREQHIVVSDGSRHLLRNPYLDGAHRHHPSCALLDCIR